MDKQNQFEKRTKKGSFPQAKHRLIKLFSSKYMLPFTKNKDNFKGGATNLEGRTGNHVDRSEVLKHNVTNAPGFKIAWGW